MMGKTHIAVGTACALAVVGSSGLPGCLAALIGGPLGSIACDLDTKSNSHCRDALVSRFIAVILAVFSIVVALLYKESFAGLLALDIDYQMLIAAAFLILAIILSRISPHRSFSHSLLALVLWTLPLALISPMVAAAFIIGFISHIILDLLNKKPVRVFFPIGDGFCLKLCHADGLMNKVLLVGGIIASIILFSINVLDTTNVLQI